VVGAMCAERIFLKEKQSRNLGGSRTRTEVGIAPVSTWASTKQRRACGEGCELCSVLAEVSVLAGMQRAAGKDGLEAWVRVRAVGELSPPSSPG
jgi:hypothetical protein